MPIRTLLGLARGVLGLVEAPGQPAQGGDDILLQGADRLAHRDIGVLRVALVIASRAGGRAQAAGTSGPVGTARFRRPTQRRNLSRSIGNPAQQRTLRLSFHNVNKASPLHEVGPLQHGAAHAAKSASRATRTHALNLGPARSPAAISPRSPSARSAMTSRRAKLTRRRRRRQRLVQARPPAGISPNAA